MKAITRKLKRGQSAALPVILGADGQVRVMLVTSRDTRRWVLPKGWVKKRATPHGQAAVEAFEEAGLIGEVQVPSVGSYRYPKYARGQAATVHVDVFLLDVEQQCVEWPEKGQREVVWVSPAEAAAMVAERDLATILARLEGSLSQR